jgi:rubrerythrin
MQAEKITSTCNEHYDLISVLYHMLEGAWKYDAFCKDAEKTGDQALAQFFRECQQDECNRAARAKELLRDRLAPVGAH